MIAGRGLLGLALAGRLARWVGAWPARRVGLAAVAGGLLVMAAVLGYAGPLLAQDGVSIAFADLSSYPTETTVDGFDVQLSNLSAAATYQVVVSSDNAAAVGVGACGTATRTRSVTGATARDLRFVVYACAVAPVTLTAEVREAGAATAAASVSRALTVLAFPVGAPAGVRGVQTMTRGVTRAGTPGIVPRVRFDNITHNSARARWDGQPSNGGPSLTGYGVLLWKKGTTQPPWNQAVSIGVTREQPLTGLEPATTYRFRIHACNGPNSCGWWTNPPKEFTTRPAPTAEPTSAPTSPTATPTPVATPTPTKKPTTAPTSSPAPGAPSFGSVGALSSNVLVGHAATLTLPAASGGSGGLTYQLAPAVGNGLTFDGATRTLAGTPQAAANRTTYTYSVTDRAKKTAQIHVHLTVFDVRVAVVQGGAYRQLANSEWGVLDYASVVLREAGFTRTDGHQLRLRLPASTGFEGGRACPRYPAPTDTTMLESPWVPSGGGFFLARCGLGAGATISYEVQVRLGTGGTAASLYTAATTIRRSWHRHDRRVLYFIRGTLANGDIDGEQMFSINLSRTPHPTLTEPLNYQNAAKAWENVPSGGVTLDRLLSGSSRDVIISGYWEPGIGIKDQCGGSVACTYGAGTYPHLGNGQVFVIEDPPRWPGEGRKEWTTSFTDAQNMGDKLEYLPWVLMHEFGHTLGLGHSPDGNAIMGGANQTGLGDTDIGGLKATYAHHGDDH